MKQIIPFLLLFIFFSSSLNAQENLDLYLCIGQSNMAGRAEIPSTEKEALTNVYLLDSLGKWIPARNPLNLHSSIRKQISMQRLSPAYSFAKNLQTYKPNIKIGLIVNAKGGSAIAEWMPGTRFFNEVIRRARQAQAHGRFRAIIWHQGESDANKTETYIDSLHVFVKALRDSLRMENLVFIGGQVSDTEARKVINEKLAQIPAKINKSEVVSNSQLNIFDAAHFDVPSTMLLGERYAEKVMHLVYNEWRLDSKHPFPKPAFEKVYKKIDTTALKAIFYYPPNFDKSKVYPVMIYFFGGGWVGGSTAQFRPHAQYFSQRGLITVLADYRVRNRQGTTPYEAVKDAKSAIRYLRKNHKELNIDPNKIIAAGGSAGGHLAAATAMIKGIEETEEDLSISSKPQALVLFNPVYDNGPGGYGFDRVGGEKGYQKISPMHNIQKGAPPAIVFFGSEDPLVPVATMEKFQWKMRLVGSKSELFVYKDAKHGFFNLGNGEKYFCNTVHEADKFLTQLGYLEGESNIKQKFKY